MTHLALHDPGTILSMELRKALVGSEAVFDSISALTEDDDEVGNLLDVGETAVRVEPLTAEALARADVLVSGSDTFHRATPLVNRLHDGDRAPILVLMAPDTPADAGSPLVEGVNLEALSGEVLVSPHPAVVLLAQLATALADAAPQRLDATVLQPASVVGQPGMNEVFGQAGALLNFQGNLPDDILGRQTAFSTSLARIGGTDLDRELTLARLLPDGPVVHLQTLQSGAFHGLGLSIAVHFASGVATSSLTGALAGLQETFWEVAPAGADVSTAETADQPHASVSIRHEDGSADAWFWVAADNLVRGSARNAVSILEALRAMGRDGDGQ